MRAFSFLCLALVTLILISPFIVESQVESSAQVHSTVCSGSTSEDLDVSEIALTGGSVSLTVFVLKDGKPVEGQTNVLSSICDQKTNVLTYHACNKKLPGAVLTNYILCSNGCNKDLTACALAKEGLKNTVCKKTQDGVEIVTETGDVIYQINNQKIGDDEIDYRCEIGGKIFAEIKTNSSKTSEKIQFDSSLNTFLLAGTIVAIILFSIFLVLIKKEKKLQKSKINKKRKKYSS